MKIDTSLWIAVDFECTNPPADDADSRSHAGPTKNQDISNEEFSVNKQFAIDYNIIKNPYYNNLKLEKESCGPTGSRSLYGYNKKFRWRLCWMVYKGIVENRDFCEEFFKKWNRNESWRGLLESHGLYESQRLFHHWLCHYNTRKCWICQKMLVVWRRFQHNGTCSKCEKTGDSHSIRKENRILENLCPLTDKFRGLAHKQCILNTRKEHCSLVPKIIHKLFQIWFSFIFW